VKPRDPEYSRFLAVFFMTLWLLTGCDQASGRGEQALHAFNQGEAAFGNGDFQLALKYYEQAQREAPGDPVIRTRIAEFDFYGNRLSEAEAALSEIVKEYPRDLRARSSLKAVQARIAAFSQGRNAVTMDEVVSVPLIIQARVPLVRLRLNGHIGTFIVATGVSTSVLSGGFARLLGIRDSATSVASLQFADGNAPFVMRNADIVVAKFNVMNIRSHQIVAGVLGCSFFSHTVATLDFERRLLIARKLGTKVTGASSMPFYWFPHASLAIQARINGIPALAVMDTSLPYDFAIPRLLLRRAHISAGKYITARSVVVGPITKHHAVGPYPARNMIEGVPIAVIGQGLLEDNSLTIDFGSMRLWLSKG